MLRYVGASHWIACNCKGHFNATVTKHRISASVLSPQSNEHYPVEIIIPGRIYNNTEYRTNHIHVHEVYTLTPEHRTQFTSCVFVSNLKAFAVSLVQRSITFLIYGGRTKDFLSPQIDWNNLTWNQIIATKAQHNLDKEVTFSATISAWVVKAFN